MNPRSSSRNEGLVQDSRRRGVTTTIVAIALHVAAFLAARPSRSVAPLVPPPEEQAAADAELEIALDGVPASPTAAAEAPKAYAAASLGGSGARLPSPEPGSAPEAPPPEPTPTTSASSAPVMLVMPSLESLGIATASGHNPFLAQGALPDMGPPTGPPASTEFHSALPVPPSPEETNRRIAQGLHEGLMRKSAVGLGPEGPVLTALKDATYGGFSPVVGGATFVAIVDDKGLVTDLRLASSWPATKDAASGWEDARAKAAAALAGKKLPGSWLGADGRGPRGAALTIRVESDLRLPSGNRPKDLPVKPTFDPSVVAVSPNLPGPGLPSDTMQAYTVGTYDLSDIGASARRVVTTRLITAAEL